MLDAAYLIPFKAKAWLDLTQKKAAGQSVDSKNIRKHKNDVFRLSALLTQQSNVVVTESVLADLKAFLAAMQEETVDLKQLGVIRDKPTIIADINKSWNQKALGSCRPHNGGSKPPALQWNGMHCSYTHVLVNDPTTGYGVFIDNMLDAAG